MRLSGLFSVPVCGIVIAVLAGCPGGGAAIKHPDVSPAAGVVTYNDKPVEGAQVLLMSAETKKNGWACAGRTDADGKFEIMTTFPPSIQEKGLPVGDYTALVLKASANTMSAAEQAEIQKKVLAGGKVESASSTEDSKSPIPVKYTEESKSDLKVKIEKAGNTKIELKLVD